VRPDTNIDPALKAWIDNVLVPALVREHLKAAGAAGDNDVRSNPQESIKAESEKFQ
jgi:hypothetical protein